MRTSIFVASALLFAACESERDTRPAADEVAFSGWVFESPASTEDDAVLGDGTLTFQLDGEDEPVEAEQPYEDYPGYWTATLPAKAPFTLRIEGDGLHPSVWAGDAPGADGSWFAGTLFGAETSFVDDWFAALAEAEGFTVQPLGTDVVHVWGQPLDGSVWDCAAVRVAGTRPRCYAVDDTGAMTPVDAGPFDWFFAFDLPPGDVEVDSGLGAVEVYPTTGGELVWAFWFATDADGG